jgi:hypothetical protein
MKRIISVSLCCMMLPAMVASQDVLYLLNNSSLTIGTNAQVTVSGGIRAESGSAMLLNGDLNIKNNTTSNQANWTDLSASGIIDGASAGRVFFQSGQPQTFSGNTVFPSVYMEGSGGLTLSNSFNVKNILHLTTGKISTGNNYVILQSTFANSLEADATNTNFINSWIDGNLRRYYNASASSYNFTSGSTSGNELVFLNNAVTPVTGINYLDAKFVPKTDPVSPVSLIEDGKTFVQVLTKGIWYLTADQAPSGGVYDLKFYLNGFSPVYDNNFILVRRPEASANDADWEIPAGSNVNAQGGEGRKRSDGYALRKSISGFSQFGIAVTAAALSVRLTGFSGTFKNNFVKLQWQTSSEHNASHFNIQRSINGSDFSVAGKVNAAGNSSMVKNYSFIDAAVANLTSKRFYYRLEQVDSDGKAALSNTIRLDVLGKGRGIVISPNPVAGKFSVQLSGTKAGENIVLIITDINGRNVMQKTFTANDGNTQLYIDGQTLNKGVYFIRAVNERENWRACFISH